MTDKRIKRQRIAGRLIDGADLVVDFATLGEYGLELTTTDADCEGARARDERDWGWEAFMPLRRRGGCQPERARHAPVGA